MHRTITRIGLILTAATAMGLAAEHPKLGPQPAEAPAYPVCFTFDPLKGPNVSRAMMARENNRLLISRSQNEQKKNGCVLRVDNPPSDNTEPGRPRVFVHVKALAPHSSKVVLVRVVNAAKSTAIYIEPLS